jgi:hypothetical protein
VQVSIPHGAILTFGAVVFDVTVADALPVQPLAGSVMMTVYVPAALTVGFCEVELNPLGPLQLNVAPVVDELALS